MLRRWKKSVDTDLDIPYSLDMAFEHENTPYGSFGEFGTEHYEYTDVDWAEHDALIAQEIAEHDAEYMALYNEGYADMVLAQWDEPDFF